MAYERKDYSGAVASTTLNGGINNSTTTVVITSATGWPTISNNGHYAVIDPGLATEEKVLVTARASTTLTVTRGGDGTSAAAHSDGATIYPCWSAVEADEANYWVAELATAASAANDLIIADGDNSLSKITKGSNSTVLGVDSGGTLGYTTVTSAMITDGTIVNGDISASAAIAYSKLNLASSIVSGDIVDGTIVNGDINASAAIAYSKLNLSGSIVTGDITDGTIALGDLAATARYKEVTFSKPGTLATGTGTYRWYSPVAVTIVDAWASVGTAPTGATLIVDVNHNGTTIFTTQSRRPTIAISGNYDLSEAPDGDVTLTAGEYLTVDIDQVGSTVAGSDLVVGIRYYET